jgi:arsenical pump membrane protein
MTYTLIWVISLISIAGVIVRPFKTTEVIWAIGGATLLVLLGLLAPMAAWYGIAKGADVYLFLTGMMLLAEIAREEKLFDWVAAQATSLAKGSPRRLFALIYGVGIVVTVFLSNDATAVVLTPAVAAAMRSAKVAKPLPYLLICAFIANAASFVLPISNPANLVIYASHMPPLGHWLALYGLPSILSIGITFWTLRWTQRSTLEQQIETAASIPTLSPGGKTALWGIAMAAVALLVCSALDVQLGLPTAITGVLTSAMVLLRTKKKPWTVIKEVSWSVIALVAGLFVIVEALGKTGVVNVLSDFLRTGLTRSVNGTAWAGGLLVAFAANGMNNLPVGLITGQLMQTGPIPESVKSAVLIGVDLGPNLSVTGSLATILWLLALRREGLGVSAWDFLKVGAVVMTTALIAALGSLWL